MLHQKVYPFISLVLIRNMLAVADLLLFRGPGFNTQSGLILLFLLQLVQEEQLTVICESMCTKYWLTA